MVHFYFFDGNLYYKMEVGRLKFVYRFLMRFMHKQRKNIHTHSGNWRDVIMPLYKGYDMIVFLKDDLYDKKEIHRPLCQPISIFDKEKVIQVGSGKRTWCRSYFWLGRDLWVNVFYHRVAFTKWNDTTVQNGYTSLVEEFISWFCVLALKFRVKVSKSMMMMTMIYNVPKKICK